MIRHWKLIVVVRVTAADALTVVSGRGTEAGFAIARVTYQTLWKWAPKPDGYVPPDTSVPGGLNSGGDGFLQTPVLAR